MTAILDTVPNVTKIRAAAGATLNVQVALQLSDGTPFDTTGGTPSTEIVDRSANGAAPVIAFATSMSGSTISLALTSTETKALRGNWYYRLWLDMPGPVRYLMCHGDLEVVAP